MKAKEAISPVKIPENSGTLPQVGGDMPLLEVLPRLLDSPTRQLEVDDEEGIPVGIIDQTSLLDALGRMIAARDDSSIITVECAPGDYSASLLARAVEDSDVHLVDLFSVPAPEGKVNVTLRVRCADPTSVVHNLERYGYEVIEAHGDDYRAETASIERLLGLKAILDV